jgi:UDP-N-acetylglucosamine 4,6-dehydratase
MNIMDLAAAVAPECKTEVVGIRPGEKLHEVMVPEDDARTTVELADRYVIMPQFDWFTTDRYAQGKRCADGFRYGSDSNDRWLTKGELSEMIAKLQLDEAQGR